VLPLPPLCDHAKPLCKQVSALEDFLFGGAAAKKLLVAPGSDDEDARGIADLVKQVRGCTGVTAAGAE
jgi:hypothetical protein